MRRNGCRWWARQKWSGAQLREVGAEGEGHRGQRKAFWDPHFHQQMLVGWRMGEGRPGQKVFWKKSDQPRLLLPVRLPQLN